MVAPVLEQIAAENEGKIRIWQAQRRRRPGVGPRFSIMSIPTLMVFKDGVAKKRIVGAKGKAPLLEDLAEFL